MGFHPRLAGAFGFQLTDGHFAYVSPVGSVLSSPSAWERAGREHCATAPCESCARAAVPSPITRGRGEVAPDLA